MSHKEPTPVPDDVPEKPLSPPPPPPPDTRNPVKTLVTSGELAQRIEELPTFETPDLSDIPRDYTTDFTTRPPGLPLPQQQRLTLKQELQTLRAAAIARSVSIEEWSEQAYGYIKKTCIKAAEQGKLECIAIVYYTYFNKQNKEFAEDVCKLLSIKLDQEQVAWTLLKKGNDELPREHEGMGFRISWGD